MKQLFHQDKEIVPTRHDNVDFKSIITKTSEIKPLSVAVADKGYDSEENHILVRERLKAYSIIPIQTYACSNMEDTR